MVDARSVNEVTHFGILRAHQTQRRPLEDDAMLRI